MEKKGEGVMGVNLEGLIPNPRDGGSTVEKLESDWFIWKMSRDRFSILGDSM